MSSINKVTLIGSLGKDPEIRTMQSGDRVANLSIATTEKWRDKNSGEKKEKTEWHSVVVFNDGLASICERYLKKGSKVYVEGSLQTRSWEDSSGEKKYKTEVVIQRFNGNIVLLDGKSEESKPYRKEAYQESTMNDIEDEIPFD
jgi:single-strand DNA-binding protein